MPTTTRAAMTRIMGSFDARRGNYRDTYRFSCAMNLANGRVRAVDISRGRDSARGERYAGRDDATSACQRAAEQRIQRDGYRNVQFGRLDADNRRNDSDYRDRHGATGQQRARL